MKWLTVTITLLFYTWFYCPAFSQNKKSDSLRNIIKTSANAAEKVEALITYANLMPVKYRDSARMFAQQALVLSQNIKYDLGIAEAHNAMAVTYSRRNNDSALFFMKQALPYFIAGKAKPTRMCMMYSNFIHLYTELGKYDSAIYYGRKGLETAKTMTIAGKEKDEQLMYLNAALGRVYNYADKMDSSTSYYFRAVSHAKQLQNNTTVSIFSQSIGTIFSRNNDYSNALYWTTNAIDAAKAARDSNYLISAFSGVGNVYYKMDNYAQARKYIDSSLMIAYRYDSTLLRSMAFTVLGNIESKEKNYEKALAHYQKGLQLEKNGLKFSRLAFQKHIADTYKNLNNLQDAERAYIQVLENITDERELKKNTLISLADLYRQRGNYTAAFEAIKNSISINDSIFNADKAKIINELNVKYQVEEKEKQLLLSENTRLVQEQLIDKQKLTLAQNNLRMLEREQQISLANLLSEQQQQQLMIQKLQLAKTNSEINQKQLILKNTSQLLQVSRQEKAMQQLEYNSNTTKLILLVIAAIAAGGLLAMYFYIQKIKSRALNEKAVLRERLRISRELHDDLGATLSGVAMYSNLIKSQIKSSSLSGAEKSLDIIKESSTQMVDRLGDMIWLLKTDQLSLEDFNQKLEDYARNMAAVKKMQLQFANNMTSDHPLAFEQRHNLYLLCKEAINNAVKYSEGDLLRFSINQTDQYIEYLIADNGKGFEPNTVKAGNGLKNMQQRATEIGADCNIQSVAGKGCTVLLRINTS
ncbi:MAG TPA: tetratricopeptide repeat protein [Niabella sp.]|nr:tetratricopeptide repeat protein [Niabella sp.]